MSDHRIHWQPGVEEIVARERREVAEQIAKAIEEDLAAWNALGTPTTGRESDAQWFVNRAMTNAARIARALADPKGKP